MFEKNDGICIVVILYPL
jgi:hypothetical protein